MMKSVGILTYHRAYNFGAVLQAYALERAIESLGHRCLIVDYRAPDEVESYPVFRHPMSRSNLAANALLMWNLRAHRRSRYRYDGFRDAHLGMTRASYGTVQELEADLDGFDVLVSGSDQVWHPSMLDRPGGRVFFQELTGRFRRVSYAPSFGVSVVPPELQGRLAEKLRRFDALSAREDSGCGIIEALTGRRAEHVLDPTLLLDATEYDRVAASLLHENPYILLYATERSEALRQTAERLRKALDLPIVALLQWSSAPWRYSYADRLVYDAGPAEFLSWIRGASFVCTNSFHGTCFAALYQRRFVTVLHGTTGTRQSSLLTMAGLADRLVRDGASIAPGSALLDQPDYEQVRRQLAPAVRSSRGYLERSLA